MGRWGEPETGGVGEREMGQPGNGLALHLISFRGVAQSPHHPVTLSPRLPLSPYPFSTSLNAGVS
jgi:hypothetical protein